MVVGIRSLSVLSSIIRICSFAKTDLRFISIMSLTLLETRTDIESLILLDIANIIAYPRAAYGILLAGSRGRFPNFELA